MIARVQMATVKLRGVLGDAVATAPLRAFQLAASGTATALWSFTVIIAVVAYRDGGATAVGLAVISRFLPAAAAAPFTALLADRFSRRNVLLCINLICAATLAVMAAVVAAHGSLVAVLVLSAVFAATLTGSRPAQAGLMPSLASSPRQLSAANAVWIGIDNAAFLIGAVVAGAIIATQSAQLALVVCALACLLAAGALAGIPRDPRPHYREAPGGTKVTRELLLGLREVAANPGLREGVGLLSALLMLDGLLDVLIVVVALQTVHLGVQGVGWLNGAWGLGGVAGAVAGVALLGRGRFASACTTSAVLVAAPLLAVAAIPSGPLALCLFVVLGAGYGILETATPTLMQRLASEEVLSRAFGVSEASNLVAASLGSGLAPVLVYEFGARGALVAAAALLPVVLALRHRAVARLDSSGEVPERAFGALRRLDLFAPLPLATIETLATRAQEVSVKAGDLVIREGDPGDRFYAILEGDVAIHQGGVLRRHEGPGEYFGEIALLRQIPRTAQVTASTNGLLLALDRDSFLSAVVGHARSTQVAGDTVSFRLGEPGAPLQRPAP